MNNSLTSQFEYIGDILKESKNIMIASHQNPDPDAVASVLAFHYAFKKMNLASLPFLPDSPSKNLSFLPGFFDIRTEVGSFDPDTIFCLDYGDFKRLRLPEVILEKRNCRIVTIDHHLEADQRGEVRVLEPDFSSTTEIIYHWLKHQKIEIDRELATLILTGIFSDSGGFCHASTSPATLNIVSEMLLKGVSLSKIARNTLDYQKPLNLSRAWGYVLSHTKLDEETGLAYSWLRPTDLDRFEVSLADFDGITNIISAVSFVNLGLFLIEYQEGKIKGSLRSEPCGGKNVAEIVKSLGGGGHPYAAGFNQEGTVEEVLKKVLNLIK